ncbi:hypothetical protein AGMMS49992_08750 [Clostridia bacterium]|nr:hypothetical protein AGMMS49992_08750 [Clostridia bacterium]
MSRLGDLLKLERTRRGMTTKQVARMCGIADKYLIDVEAGSRIIADDQARRILKRIGLEQQNEAEFSLDAIAAAADLAATAQKINADDNGAYSRVRASEPPPIGLAQTVASLPARTEDGGGIFLSALSEVLRQVPVYDAGWKVVDNRVLPIVGGRIEGGAPDKVLYFRAPDASCRGFRILPGDLALILPAQSPIDGAIMLVEFNGHRALRKIKLSDNNRVTLQSYDQEFEAEALPLEQVSFVGRVARIEITL